MPDLAAGSTTPKLDLAMREADVAIRLHRPNQSEMIQRKLFTVHNHFYVSRTGLSSRRVRRATGRSRKSTSTVS